MEKVNFFLTTKYTSSRLKLLTKEDLKKIKNKFNIILESKIIPFYSSQEKTNKKCFELLKIPDTKTLQSKYVTIIIIIINNYLQLHLARGSNKNGLIAKMHFIRFLELKKFMKT